MSEHRVERRQAQQRGTYSVPEAAFRLGIATSTAWKHVASGRIPVLRLGGRTLVTRATVERLLAEPEGGPQQDGRGPRLVQETGS